VPYRGCDIRFCFSPTDRPSNRGPPVDTAHLIHFSHRTLDRNEGMTEQGFSSPSGHLTACAAKPKEDARSERGAGCSVARVMLRSVDAGDF
jgi:hypothetical protein